MSHAAAAQSGRDGETHFIAWSWGMCDVNSCNVILLLFMALWAVLTLWRAFLLLGLWFFPSFLLFAWWPPLLFLVRTGF
jgi:hypothetical protein